MNLIEKYIIAATNLYGQVTVDVITEIYNSQIVGQISKDDVEAYFYEDLSKQYVYAYKKHFVHETIMEFNGFKSMRKKKADKPHYIPGKEELLQYSDMTYYKKPKQYDDLLSYLEKNFFSDDYDKAESLCQNIRWECLEGPDMQQVFDMFNTYQIDFKGEKQVNEVLQLVMELANNARLWENNGHTPNEIFEMFEKPKLKPLPDKPFEMGSVKKEKIGRNDLCPCGSGKKYKKCCLGKE
jgi:hypothetical protein